MSIAPARAVWRSVLCKTTRWLLVRNGLMVEMTPHNNSPGRATARLSVLLEASPGSCPCIAMASRPVKSCNVEQAAGLVGPVCARVFCCPRSVSGLFQTQPAGNVAALDCAMASKARKAYART